ncbi:metalloregulator ArsR/SmtB family transcription factor, partial [Klebsiella pneumoniae]|uniref:metalloregulator ArsR/SmtB family transcription factor n=1 Tax=Klebsiella pneumoniae TaxID=573 RepID=UPI002E81C2BA
MPLTALKLFKNLSDETRLGIVLLLRELGEPCVCDFCTALDESQPKISRHLAMLRESGLLLVSDEAAFCLIQRPYISKTLLTRRISP